MANNKNLSTALGAITSVSLLSVAAVGGYMIGRGTAENHKKAIVWGCAILGLSIVVSLVELHIDSKEQKQ